MNRSTKTGTTTVFLAVERKRVSAIDAPEAEVAGHKTAGILVREREA